MSKGSGDVRDSLTLFAGRVYPPTMKAEIISVGTEILLGEILDTNAQYIASKLPALGIENMSVETLRRLCRDGWRT